MSSLRRIPFDFDGGGDDHGGIVELPNGQLVCGSHGLVICGICTVDFSFMEDEIEDEGDYHASSDDDGNYLDYDGTYDYDHDDEEPEQMSGPSKAIHFTDDLRGPQKKTIQGTGRVFPSLFTPDTPTATPLEIFKEVNTYWHFIRYIHRRNKRTGLIFTDGACLGNGQEDPRAGWAFVCGPPTVPEDFSRNVINGRLEQRGPKGERGLQTSNRAELRAVIAALRFRAWNGEGFSTLVFATDSEYVVQGATKWAKTWFKNGWRIANGGPVKNKDLWLLLLGEIEKYESRGLQVQFWRIRRELNAVADRAAKEGALNGSAEQFLDISGL